MSNAANISQENKEVIRNLYLSGIGEELIAMQLDLEIPVVIQVLKELGEYKSWMQVKDKNTWIPIFIGSPRMESYY